MYMQIEDIDKRFNNLEKLKENNWEEILIASNQPTNTKIGVTKPTRGRPKKGGTAKSKIKDMIKMARLRMNNPNPDQAASEALSDPSPKVRTPSVNKRRSLRASTINSEATKRLSSSPCVVMLRLSQALKLENGLTPGKSILKTDLNRSEKRHTKSVLFKDMEDDKENSQSDLIKFTPTRPRRSRRLNQVD